MKKNVSLILLTFLFACRSQHPMQNESLIVSVVADSTDRHLLLPKGDPILRLYTLDQNPSAEAVFRFKAIKNTQLVPIAIHHLPPEIGRSFNGDPQARNRQIAGFYADVRKTLDRFNAASKTIKELSHSECFFAIQQELQYLSHQKWKRRILLIYSNLFERSFIDLYSKRVLKAKEIATVLEKEHPLPAELNGILVYVVFDPGTDRKADTRFQEVVKAYQNLLETRGAKVLVQATGDQFLN